MKPLSNIMKHMKNVVIVFFIFFHLSCNREKSFLIEAQILGIGDSTMMMLQNLSSGEYIDSSIVINSEFIFKGRLVDEPVELRIITSIEEIKMGKLYYTDLLIKNENVKIRADVNDLPLNVSSSGSPTQKKAEIYRKQLHLWNLKLDSLKNRLHSYSDSTSISEKIKQKIIEVKKARDNWNENYLINNFNTYFALLMYNYRRDFSNRLLDSLFTNLPTELKNSEFGKSIQIQIEYPKLNNGDLFYDFEGVNQDDEEFNLSSITDKYILLQFAGTGCYGSNLSVKKMVELHAIYNDSIAFVSAFFDPPKDFKQYVVEHSISWTCIWTSNGKYGIPPSKYHITGTPTFYLISPNKTILKSWFGYEEGIIEKNIRTLLYID